MTAAGNDPLGVGPPPTTSITLFDIHENDAWGAAQERRLSAPNDHVRPLKDMKTQQLNHEKTARIISQAARCARSRDDQRPGIMGRQEASDKGLSRACCDVEKSIYAALRSSMDQARDPMLMLRGLASLEATCTTCSETPGGPLAFLMRCGVIARPDVPIVYENA